MMRDIYEKAERTIVWLGEEADNSRLALDMCSRMLTAHGNTYLRQTLGVDVEKMFTRSSSTSGASVIPDEATLHRVIVDFASKFDLEDAVVDPEGEAGMEWEDIGRRVALGEEYNGPYKEVVYAAVAEAMAEATEEEEGDAKSESDSKDGNEENSNIQSAIGERGDIPKASDGELTLDASAVVPRSGGSEFHRQLILQILQAYGHDKQKEAATRPTTSEEIAALYALFERPWFNRIWIVQEAGVSSQIFFQCGGQTIDWWTFCFGYLITQRLERKARMGPKSHRNLVVMSRTRSSIHVSGSRKDIPTTELGLSLLALLSLYRGYTATDPRDKVFALLGISSSDMGMAPDYSKSNETVFLEVATCLLESSPTLEIFASCHIGKMAPKILPSWVPDWNDHSPKPYKLAGNQEFESSEVSSKPLRIFNASSDTAAFVKINHNKLRVKGFVLEKIVQVARVLHINQAGLRMPVEIGQMTDIASVVGSVRRFFAMITTMISVIEEWKVLANIDIAEAVAAADDDRFTVFARTLWADLEDPDICAASCEEWTAKLAWLSDITQTLPSFEIEPKEQNLMQVLQQMMPFIQALDMDKVRMLHKLDCPHILERRLGKTNGGRLCLLPASTEAGDSIALLQGGRTPYILRAAGGSFELVGETFVHGTMYGKAWDVDRCEEICLV